MEAALLFRHDALKGRVSQALANTTAPSAASASLNTPLAPAISRESASRRASKVLATSPQKAQPSNEERLDEKGLDSKER